MPFCVSIFWRPVKAPSDLSEPSTALGASAPAPGMPVSPRKQGQASWFTCWNLDGGHIPSASSLGTFPDEDYAGPFWGSLHPNPDFPCSLEAQILPGPRKSAWGEVGKEMKIENKIQHSQCSPVGYREQRSPSEMRQIIAPRRSRTNTICSR